MIATLPSELEPFVQTEIASGRFATADDVVVAAVKLLREVSTHPQSTLEELDAALCQIRDRKVVREERVRELIAECDATPGEDIVLHNEEEL
ncbi:MAG: type II toxin-antitoxin system ParD family antitoxin, partial [Planctomycetaceae bacterium]|nr:type II toxin-antitoxin system ParD family antitoxin [Planctomycetaceae bacterium]